MKIILRNAWWRVIDTLEREVSPPFRVFLCIALPVLALVSCAAVMS